MASPSAVMLSLDMRPTFESDEFDEVPESERAVSVDFEEGELLLEQPPDLAPFSRRLRSRWRRFWNHTWICLGDTRRSIPSCLRASTFGN